MNQIYLFEIFMDQLIFMEDIENTEIVANITGGNLLDIYVLLMKNVILTDTEKIPPNPIAHKFYKGGKSVFFSSTPEKVIEAFETNLSLTINATEPKHEFGKAKLRWNDKFRKEVLELTENIKNIRYIDQFEIMDDEKKIAKIDLNMLLLCYGETIEMSIANVMSSSAAIPIMIPKYGNAKPAGKRSGPVNDPWSSLFNSPHKEKHSIVDVDLMIYAQMAGIVTDEILESKRLTVDYINERLCGHKSCPGAIRFRDWGIGPLASPGSGLGTIGSLNEAKTNGMYGMSQAYGTMQPYGAYGLFVNSSKPTKTKCNSPVCPFTNPDEAEQERLIGESMDEALEESCCIQNKNKAVKCTCKCCGKKYVKKFPSTCEDPLCPSVPKKRSYKCKGPICPHTVADNPSRIDCGGEECPAFKEEDPTCEGKICPYSAGNIKKCCVTESCPKETAKRLRGGADDMSSLFKKCKCCNRLMRKKTKLTNVEKRKVGGADDCDPTCINVDGSYIYEYGVASTQNWRSQSNLPNSCNDPNCNFKHFPDSDDGEGQLNTIADLDDFTTTDSSWGKPPPQTSRKSATFSPETCIIKKCKVDADGKRHDYEVTKGPGADAKIERLTRLVNEASQNLVTTSSGKKNLDPEAITKSLLNTKHLLSDVVSFEEDDDEMIYLIARLLGQREFSHSMNNFYMDDYFNECRLKERNDQATKQINVNDETCLALHRNSNSKHNQVRVKQKRRGPCQKDTCQYMKYKTCSECGGISKSGATCDNSDVSFSYISYSDIAEESIEESAERQDRKLNTPNDAKNISNNNKHQAISNSKTTTDRKHVDIKQKRRRKNRFIYNCGETYPGIRLGHKYCRINERNKNNVPYDMGWLWSIKPEGIKRRRKNWKPGMINTTINDRIIEYRKKRGIPDPPQLKMIVPTKKKDKGVDENETESSDEEIEPKPTLIIQKKEGSYLITMNPLKDPKTLAPHENPYMQCKPMQFIITRPKPPPKKEPRRSTGDGGEGEDAYDAMYDDDECFCNKDDNENKCESSSSSESELNIEFTTPAGLIYPEEMKRPPNVIHTSTQFKDADFNCQDCPIILPKKFTKRGKNKQKKK